jgi:NADH-quinone oxidoreductase subunit G
MMDFDEIFNLMVDKLPVFSKLKNYYPGADFRMFNEKIPRQAKRYSGRTSINANINVSEGKIPEDKDSPLAFSMEGYWGYPPESLISINWYPGWNSVQASIKHQALLNLTEKDIAGLRLLDSNNEKHLTYSANFVEPLSPKTGDFFIVPVYRIFGSEELSSMGKAISSRIQYPFILINKSDSETQGISENETIELRINNHILKVKVKLDNCLQPGLIGLSANFAGMPYLNLPATGQLIICNS